MTVDRFAGCLLGGAIGDALGAPVEFMDLEEIRTTFGPEGLQGLEPAYGRVGAITDDTQMTLFTAEGLLRAWNEYRTTGVGPLFGSMTHQAYLRWLKTQEEIPTKVSALKECGLLAVPELHARRAPGQTCLSALASGKKGTLSKPINDSKGCGSVMRSAPVGLFLASPYVFPHWEKDGWSERVFALGEELSAITHGHPTAGHASGFLALLVGWIVRGHSLERSLQEAVRVLETRKHSGECLDAVRTAVKLAVQAEGESGPGAIARLGEGWTAEEALAISLYCALVCREDFRRGLLLAVNHDGDSDSTGAITGNILGALLGKEAVPKEWLAELEMADVIKGIGRDLRRANQLR